MTDGPPGIPYDDAPLPEISLAEAEAGGDDIAGDVSPGEAMIPLGDILQKLSARADEAEQDLVKAILPSTRTPPNAADAEQALLGGLMIEPASFERVIEEQLRPEDFYRRVHGIIFKAMLDLYHQAEPVDTLTVADELLRRGQLDTVGGAPAISQLEALIPTAAHVGAYARLVREKATLRRLIETATEIVTSAYKQEQRVHEILDEAERAILAISEANVKKGIIPMAELVKRATEQLEKAYNAKSAITGIPSGFRDFDQKTSGFQPGDLIIIAARPSMGKTAFTLNIAAHASMRAAAPVAFFSLEMGADQLVQRLLGAEARIDISALRRGFIQRHEWANLAKAAGELGEAQLYIDETPSISVAEMRTKCRRLAHEAGIKLVVVDYLQLMTGPPGIENKATEVGEISKGLKTLARELGVPVVALSQLNRGVESRTDKRPMMSDLRESGAIEQDADLISFLYREEYYLKEKTPEDKMGVAEIIIGKHRNGPTGSIELLFESAYTRFRDLARDNEHAP